MPAGISLSELNRLLEKWLNDYHDKKHSSTSQAPLKRYLAGLHLIRKAPSDIETYFRTRVCRRVNKDRTVSLKSHLFEAPVGLVGKKVE